MLKCLGASPFKKPKTECKGVDETTKDIFSDSFTNVVDELDKLEHANQSCPKTPRYAINSEKLELDESISDSFLEQAFKSHLSEFESKSKLNLESSPMRSQRLRDRKKLVKKQNTNPRYIMNSLIDFLMLKLFFICTFSISPGLVFSESESDFSKDSFSINMTTNKNEATEVAPDLTKLSIVDICANKLLFDTFKSEVEQQKNIALTLACDKWTPPKGSY